MYREDIVFFGDILRWALAFLLRHPRLLGCLADLVILAFVFNKFTKTKSEKGTDLLLLALGVPFAAFKINTFLAGDSTTLLILRFLISIPALYIFLRVRGEASSAKFKKTLFLGFLWSVLNLIVLMFSLRLYFYLRDMVALKTWY